MCGKPAQVCVLTQEHVAGSSDLVLFCDTCALQGVRKLQPCPRLTILTINAATEQRHRVDYEVLTTDLTSNLAQIKNIGIKASATNSCKVRLDAIPAQARTAGSQFHVLGTASEILLFENCGSENVQP
jgi:hypothetical protein